MVNLLDLDAAGLARLLTANGEKPFRARQLSRWIHQLGVCDPGAMTDLSKSLRERLVACTEVRIPAVVRESTAPEGTRKWLLDVGGSNAVETVLIPERARLTLCISSQAGCALECAFCSTGRQGFNRNLSTGEIIGQLWWANHRLSQDHEVAAGSDARRITNVVLMGMGEPLANYEAVVTALRVMLDDTAYGLSRRRVTLSTAGLVTAMDRLREDCPVALAVSLHAPNDALRDRLVPINRKWPIRELMAACQRYIEKAPRDFVTFEYVMLRDVNDTPAHARELIAAVREVPCKINLIPFNPFSGSGFERSSDGAIARFLDTLAGAGIVTTVRRTRGDDIDAACGQLAGRVKDRTRRTARRMAELPA